MFGNDSNSTPREADALECAENLRTYIPSSPTDKRSPCLALNALANHGYLPRAGTHITLLLLIRSLCEVYNLTYPLSALLALTGFLSCGRFEWVAAMSLLGRVVYIPRWTLDLSALSQRTGFMHIAHDGALVHPDERPSTSPDPGLLAAFLAFPHTNGKQGEGFRLIDFARFQAERRRRLKKPLDAYHKEIAGGECGLVWMVMGEHERSDTVVPLQRVQEWFGEERLPAGWVRPVKPIGIFEARKRCMEVKKDEGF